MSSDQHLRAAGGSAGRPAREFTNRPLRPTPGEPAAPSSCLSDDIFVGREREMEELRASLQGAPAGRGRLVLLVGEPGIGKSRAAQELATYARGRARTCSWAVATRVKGLHPFWPWAQIVRTYIADSQAGHSEGRDGSGRTRHCSRSMDTPTQRIRRGRSDDATRPDRARFVGPLPFPRC
jgi:AAA ATPase-like protein